MVSKFKEGDEILIEWLPGDVREAIVIAIFDDRYLIKYVEYEIESLVYEEEIIPKNASPNPFFGG